MIVVSDTTALSGLIRIGELSLLNHLFNEVIIPPKVYAELLELKRFGIDISTLNQNWLKVQQPTQSLLLSQLLQQLDEGEAQAIALAVEIRANLLIVDEMEGRKIALQLHLPITGIGGIFIRAKRAGLIQAVKPLLERLMTQANYYLSEAVYQKILTEAGE